MASEKHKHYSKKELPDKKEEDNEGLALPVENLPELENMSRKELIQVVSTFFRGPLPDPQTMREYEAAFPGAADRIIAMTEKELMHSHEMDKIIVRTESRDSLLGIIAAFLTALFIVGCGTYIIIAVPGVAGAVSGSLLNLTGIATVIGKFLRGGRTDNKEDAAEKKK